MIQMAFRLKRKQPWPGNLRAFFPILMVFVYFLFSITPVFAEASDSQPEIPETGRIRVSLAEILRLALQNSSVIRVNHLLQQTAASDLVIAREPFLSRVTTSYQNSRRITPDTSTSLEQLQGLYDALGISAPDDPYLSFVAQDTQMLSATWNKTDLNGITYGLGYSKVKVGVESGDIIEAGNGFNGWTDDEDPIFIDTVTALIQVPICKDWGEINRLPEQYSRQMIQQTSIQSDKDKKELLQYIGLAYWDLVASHRKAQILKSTRHYSEKLLKEAEFRNQVGTANPISIRHAESRLAMTMLAIQQEMTNLTQVMNRIRIALNLQNRRISFIPTESLVIRDDQLDFDSLLSKTLKASHDLALLQNERHMNRLEMKKAENEGKSDIDLTFEYRMNGYSQNIQKATGEMDDLRLHDFQFGLSWTVPLFDPVTSEKMKKARLAETRLSIQIQDLKSQLSETLQSLLTNLKLARQAIYLAEKSTLLVESLLIEEQARIKLGESTGFQITEIQQDLVDARNNEIQSRVQYKKLFFELLVLTEQIYEDYDLENI